MAMRNFREQGRALGRPAASAGHVRLGPSLVQKNQSFRCQPALIFLPEPAFASPVPTIRLGGPYVFETEPGVTNQAPDRDLAGDNAALAQLNRQGPHRQILLLGQPTKNPSLMRRQSASLLAPLRLCRRTTRLPRTLRPLHSTRNTDRKQRCHFPARATRQNRRRNTFPQVIRIMPAPMLTSDPAISSNQIFSRAGAPKYPPGESFNYPQIACRLLRRA